MKLDQLITILGSIATILIVPLLLDWIKRQWDYNTSANSLRFEVLSELNLLIWNYHAVTGRLYQLSAFMRISTVSKDEIDDVTNRFTVASDALYSGLYNCRSRIHLYFDGYEGIDLAIDDLRDWTFHGGECLDNFYLTILHALAENNREKADWARNKLDTLDPTGAASTYRVKAEKILQLLAQQLRKMNSFWYPLRRRSYGAK